MQYVFFDIECACVFKSVAKICAFGYVLTDENFNVLEREDILLNPKGKFHLTDRKGKEGLVLPYEYEDFKKYPLFPSAYKRIKTLLESKEHIVLGHATLNDVNYLNLETKRYKLPSFRFFWHDTQFFWMNTANAYGQQLGLGAIAEQLGVEFTPHRAVDDAYATMRVCEAMCKREGVDVQGLLLKYGMRAGRIENYRISQPTSVGLKKYLDDRHNEREAHHRAHEEFYRFVNKNMHRRKKGGNLEGKVFCFSKELEDEVATSVRLVKAIFDGGGRYTSRPGECNVYIARDTGGMRYQNALQSGAAFIPLDSIEDALGSVQA